MKTIAILLVSLFIIGCSVAGLLVASAQQSSRQSAGHDIDWKDCRQFEKKWEADIASFNAAHAKAGDGLRIEAGCRYSQPGPQKPQRKIALTPQEAARLNELRRVSMRAYSAESGYEEKLIEAHGIKKPEYGDPCWHYIGIIVDEDFITVDPNTSMPGCNEN